MLLAKLYQMEAASTCLTEQIARLIFDPQVTSGNNSVRFASEYGFSYGQVVQVKRDLLVRLVDWACDGDIAFRYATAQPFSPAYSPHANARQGSPIEVEVGQAEAAVA